MADSSEMRTRVSLLARLRDSADEAAWGLFVDRYGPKIYGWCRHWGLQQADAEDVTQTVLLKLAAKLRHFEYDRSKSFRAWLKTLAQHAWADFLDGQRRQAVGSGDSVVVAKLHSLEARDDLEARLTNMFDLELLEKASELVRQRVAPRTWEAYRATAVEQLSGAEAAARLGVSVAVAYQARSKVQKMLCQEIERLGQAEFQ